MTVLRACLVCGRPSQGRRCPDHERKDTRPSARARGYDGKWERFAKTFLKAHPRCEDEAGCTKPATDVDHIDGLGPKGPRGFDPFNCRALCHSHHAQRTARDQPGGFNRPGG